MKIVFFSEHRSVIGGFPIEPEAFVSIRQLPRFEARQLIEGFAPCLVERLAPYHGIPIVEANQRVAGRLVAGGHFIHIDYDGFQRFTQGEPSLIWPICGARGLCVFRLYVRRVCSNMSHWLREWLCSTSKPRPVPVISMPAVRRTAPSSLTAVMPQVSPAIPREEDRVSFDDTEVLASVVTDFLETPDAPRY